MPLGQQIVRTIFSVAVAAILSFSITTPSSAERPTLRGFTPGMAHTAAIDNLKRMERFKQTSWDGTVIVDNQQCILVALWINDAECETFRLKSVKLGNKNPELWQLAEMSFRQRFKDAIIFQDWLQIVEEKIGPLSEAPDQNHYNKVFDYNTRTFYILFEGSHRLLDILIKDGWPYSSLIALLIEEGCKEKAVFGRVNVDIFNVGGVKLVKSHEITINDAQLICLNVKNIKSTIKEKYQGNEDQIQF